MLTDKIKYEETQETMQAPNYTIEIHQIYLYLHLVLCCVLLCLPTMLADFVKKLKYIFFYFPNHKWLRFTCL